MNLVIQCFIYLISNIFESARYHNSLDFVDARECRLENLVLQRSHMLLFSMFVIKNHINAIDATCFQYKHLIFQNSEVVRARARFWRFT